MICVWRCSLCILRSVSLECAFSERTPDVWAGGAGADRSSLRNKPTQTHENIAGHTLLSSRREKSFSNVQNQQFTEQTALKRSRFQLRPRHTAMTFIFKFNSMSLTRESEIIMFWLLYLPYFIEKNEHKEEIAHVWIWVLTPQVWEKSTSLLQEG